MHETGSVMKPAAVISTELLENYYYYPEYNEFVHSVITGQLVDNKQCTILLYQLLLLAGTESKNTPADNSS